MLSLRHLYNRAIDTISNEGLHGLTKRTWHKVQHETRELRDVDFKGIVNKVGQFLGVGAAQGNLSLLLVELGYEVTWNDLRSVGFG